jgi:hypothetical protein
VLFLIGKQEKNAVFDQKTQEKARCGLFYSPRRQRSKTDVRAASSSATSRTRSAASRAARSFA